MHIKTINLKVIKRSILEPSEKRPYVKIRGYRKPWNQIDDDTPLLSINIDLLDLITIYKGVKIHIDNLMNKYTDLSNEMDLD